MKWSIIYEVDCKKEQKLTPYIPRNGKWKRTEHNSEYDYDYLGKEYENGRHAKWIGWLSDKNFRRFLDNTLMPYFVESTLGMIGGMTPEGMSLGWMPAVCLSPELYRIDDPIQMSAYVCPFPESDEELALLQSLQDDEDLEKWIKDNYL